MNEVRAILKQLRKNGVQVDSSGKHNKLFVDGQYVYAMVKTPSDHRSVKNTLADLRRLGLLPRKS